MDAALEKLLDPGLKARVIAVGEAVRARDGLRRGADVIESVGRVHVDAVEGAGA